MLQQWARRYVTITQPPRYSPHRRAPIRAFFANGVDKFHLPWSVEVLPTLLHLSLFLFFSGLGIFLFNINHTVFSVVIWWVGLAGTVYVCVTLMPMFWHDSPYYAPLSSSVWLLYAGIQYAVSHIFNFLWHHHCRFIFMWPGEYRRRLLGGMTEAIQDTGEKLSAEINGRILTWILHSLDEDKDLEQFIEAIPGFCGSDAIRVWDPASVQIAFTKLDETLKWAFYGFIDRTLTASSVLAVDKRRRIITCVKAVDSAHLTHATMGVLGHIFRCGRDLLRSVEIGRSLRSSDGVDPGLCSQGIISVVIASVPERDEDWLALARYQLGVSDEVVRHYLANGFANVLLANFIHISRPLFHLCLSNITGTVADLGTVLIWISKFDIESTLPELQHKFCALWNEIVREAHKSRSPSIAFCVLQPIWHLYIALHPGTDAIPSEFDPSSYPLCNIPGHHSDTVIGDRNSTPLPATDVAPSTKSVLSSFAALGADHRRIEIAEQSSPHDVPGATDTNNVDLSVVSDIPLSTFPASVPNDTVPANIRSSLASPAFQVNQVIAAPDRLPLLSTSATAILPAPPEETSVLQPATASNDGTFDDRRDPDLRYNVAALEQFQESATSVAEVATDVLRHPFEAASVSRDIDHSE
jgi:Family of unknown function (DUF6535)